MGAGTVVDGGYLVSGAWQWSSGSEHATWAFLGGPVIKDGRPVAFGSFLIPRTEYTIDDVWHVVGMKGTGSNTVVVQELGRASCRDRVGTYGSIKECDGKL